MRLPQKPLVDSSKCGLHLHGLRISPHGGKAVSAAVEGPHGAVAQLQQAAVVGGRGGKVPQLAVAEPGHREVPAMGQERARGLAQG